MVFSLSLMRRRGPRWALLQEMFHEVSVGVVKVHGRVKRGFCSRNIVTWWFSVYRD